MPCSRKKKVKAPKKGRFQCQACGQVRKKSSKLCKPEVIDEPRRARALQVERAGRRK